MDKDRLLCYKLFSEAYGLAYKLTKVKAMHFYELTRFSTRSCRTYRRVQESYCLR